MDLQGLLVVDKPSGPTSHDVVAKVRRVVGIKRVGHAGTLDPMATGVVVIGMGRATRLLRFVQESVKEYSATVRFGIATDTLDADGRETWREPMPVSPKEVVATLEQFVGTIQQVPPMVSALKVGGRRLYELARSGEQVERHPRQVEISSLRLVAFESGEYPVAILEVECSKGTYIRVLADDIARALGGRAHLQALRRTRIDGFGLQQAISLDRLDEWEQSLLAPLAAVAEIPRLIVDEAQRSLVQHGRPLAVDSEEGLLAIVDRDKGLLAVYRVQEGQARPEVVLA